MFCSTSMGRRESTADELEDHPLVSEAAMMQREMLIKVRLGKPMDEIAQEDMALLKEAVEVHGAICVVGAHLGPEGLKALAEKWGEVIALPLGLAFKSQVPGLPEIARVGNVQLDGSVKPGVSAAEYWHHDGDFWPVGKHGIFNFLCSVMVPETGGRTGFLDTRKAYLALGEDERAMLEDAFTVVRLGDIPDFDLEDFSDSERPVDVAHKVVQRSPVTGEASLYLPSSSSGIQLPGGRGIGESESYIEAIASDPCLGIVEFAWTEGDLLIWDNRTTMHRSMGGYSNSARLLYRAQARVSSPRLRRSFLSQSSQGTRLAVSVNSADAKIQQTLGDEELACAASDSTMSLKREA